MNKYKISVRYFFAQFHAPLVVGVNAPNSGLAKHLVLVQSHQGAHAAGGEGIYPNGGAGHIAWVAAVGCQALHFVFVQAAVAQGLHGFLRRTAKCQGLGLGLHVE